jgi:hypothetical protein
MGEHYVAVAFDKLKWVDEPVRSAAAVTNAPDRRCVTPRAAATTGAATATTTRATKTIGIRTTPSQRDQGSAAGLPQFKY